MAKLYFKYGAMGSSKTAQALITKFNYEERGMSVWLIKPSTDDRDGATVIRSRIGLSAEADVVFPGDDLRERFAAVGRRDVIIADESGEYVCFSGMWWVPENRLAYMEPLCTVPAHQHKGLAAAALSRHDQVLRKLGAEVMTGGGNEFYRKIGYQDTHVVFHLKKA